jgi:glucokinase
MPYSEPVCLGLDMGGTKILAGMVSVEGKILHSQRFPMDRTSQASTLASLHAVLSGFLPTWDHEPPRAAGVGLPGHIDRFNGVWVQAMSLPISQPIALAVQIQAEYGLPAALDNDVHAATLAELRWGAGCETNDFLYLNVGTGLAAGIVANGQLVRGAVNYAGEIGHMRVEPDGELCVCGQRGCLETLASGGGILAQVRKRLPDNPDSTLAKMDGSKLTTESVFRAAAETNDPLAVSVTERAIHALGIAFVNLVNIMNPEKIIYGGGVVSDGWLMSRVSEFVLENSLPVAKQSLEGIVPSTLNPEQVGLLGAASLAWASIEKG